ncbi:hypothetical protein Q5P01_005999 [Channa striata]|uniref:ZZ-type domain-containing protein n=1 Tax=Channa striata TaxID=64152 RepID=A0AA88NDN2_CHASR|nr:hypothetical protein Q5P01_005999 [Channa striata]
MNLDSLEGLNEVGPSVYRAAMKLQSLQKLCHLDVISIRHIMAALQSETGAQQEQGEVGIKKDDMTQTLNRMFDSVGHVSVAAPEEICSLMLRLYDWSRTGLVSAASLQTALIALSADNLLTKYKALVRVSENCSGSISRSGLRSLLHDLSQVPAAVQEEVVFGGVEAAVKSCFNGVLTQTASKEHVLSWLHSNPRLLLWLPTLSRLSVSQKISHTVRCHSCKAFPITGLRYRCRKCINVHLCQSCFLANRQTGKHKPHHPVLEFCTQPTWKESLSSLMHSARYVLLPWRYTQRGADRRVLMWAEPEESPNSGPPPSETSTQLADQVVHHSHSSDKDVSHDASVHPLPRSCKALQTDEETPTQQMESAALLTEVRNLYRDKWLLEQDLQAWRLTVQSEQGILEDRCSEMEVTMEMLKKHHMHLQAMLSETLNKMDTQQPANNMPRGMDMENPERGNISPTSDTFRDAEEEDDIEVEENQQTPSPSIHSDTPLSHLHCMEEELFTGDSLLHLLGEDSSKGAELQEEDLCLSEEVEDCDVPSAEELLQQTVNRLQIDMEKDGWRERQTGERKRVELLEAAVQVGKLIHHLVDGVRTNAL